MNFRLISKSGLGFIRLAHGILSKQNPFRGHQIIFYSSDSNNVFKRSKPLCNIGTIGHYKHGKTTLTAAITKVLSEKNLCKRIHLDEIDNAPEEREKGYSINSTLVNYATVNRHYSHTDCPGHYEYIKNAITGISQMDSAILVVAATEGALYQTKEHLILAKQNGIEHLVVYINKMDCSDSEAAELIEIELRESLAMSGFKDPNIPFITGSALCALEDTQPDIGKESINKLLEAVDSYIPTPIRDLEKPFFMPIEHVFSITGKGTVVRGKVEQGSLKKGQEVEIVGFDRKFKTTVSGLEIFRQPLEEAYAGDKLSILLKGMKRNDLQRGMILGKPDTLQNSDQAQAQIYILKKEEGITNTSLTSFSLVNIYSKTWKIDSMVFLEKDEMIKSGESGFINLHFKKPMVIQQDQKFSIRDSKNTIGTGVFTTLLPSLTDDQRSKLGKGYKKEREALYEKLKIDKLSTFV